MKELSKSKKLSRFIATGFGSGLSPKAPGTCGTLAIFIISLLILNLYGSPDTLTRILFAIIASISSLLSAGYILNDYPEEKRKDPQEIVMDEFAGFLTTMIFFEWTTATLISGFILFRLFDISKPGPIKWLEKLPGTYGILLDDIGAGLLASLCILSWIYLF